MLFEKIVNKSKKYIFKKKIKTCWLKTKKRKKNARMKFK